MMYVSYLADLKVAHKYLLCVILDQEIWERIEYARTIQSPYLCRHVFSINPDKARIIAADDRDELLEDKTVVPDWARGCEDALDYYQYGCFEYEPKEDYSYADKPINLDMSVYGDLVGFAAYKDGVFYEGYCGQM